MQLPAFKFTQQTPRVNLRVYLNLKMDLEDWISMTLKEKRGEVGVV